MNPVRNVTNHSQARLRTGDGVNVPVTVREVNSPAGATVSEVQFDIADLPVPDRRYRADIAYLDFDGDGLRVAFGQTRLGTPVRLRTLVVLHLSKDATRRFVQSCTNFYPIAKQELSKNQEDIAKLLDSIEEPDTTVALDVNVLAAAHTGLEACLDCYMISPWATMAMRSKKSGEIGVEPVVRITLSLKLLVAVLEAIAGMAKLPFNVEVEND